MAKMVQVKCERCKTPFFAREADRKRGWGKYCSKSCKAIKQTQRTGYYGPNEYSYENEVIGLPDHCQWED